MEVVGALFKIGLKDDASTILCLALDAIVSLRSRYRYIYTSLSYE